MAKKPIVYYGSMIHGQAARFASLGSKFDEMIKKLDFNTISKGDKVALKMHLGFQEDFQTVPVYFVRKIVKAVKDVGGYPFVTDNPTAIYNAVDRGYTSETCGCPLIPIAGLKDRYVYQSNIEYGGVGEIGFAGVLHDCDVLIEVSHAKGHGVSGYGGAIKNIAIGGLAAGSRWHKMHGIENHIPWWDGVKCMPEHAEELVKVCPSNALRYDAKKHKMAMVWNNCRNSNCMKCMEADKGVGCIEIKAENFQTFSKIMAFTAAKVLEGFKPEKRFFFNFLLDITPQCNCLGMIQPQIVPDIGVTASKDIVAIEEATLDLIAGATFLPEMIPLYVGIVNLDKNLHPFQRIWGGFKNPYDQVMFAEELGLGSRKYRLIEILPPSETVGMEAPKIKYEDQPTFY
ncbi:MAG: DUF362 domain-containing protein [Candidatus Bathyarchaeia archaeon]|jgi:uncharacterized Fe-S center protein